MARYGAYKYYKNAQSKWVDVIPKHWERAPLKAMVSRKITDGPHETPEFLDEGIPFLSAESVKNNSLSFARKRGFISRKLHEEYSKKCLPAVDDIFMVKSGNTTGNIAMVETNEEFNIWSPLALVRANINRVLPKFMFYSMLADFFQTSVKLSWSQGTQPNIGMNVIENLQIALAPLNEQSKIVDFLDHETAKIDTLIEKQQELIKLLKEKRQAVISHAVTKGLNPNALMRDSGVEWLGEVPEHWEVKKFKYVCENIIAGPFGSSITKDMYVKSGYKVYGQEQVIPNDFSIGDYFISAKNYWELSRYAVEPGNILISCVGTFGKIAVFPDGAEKGIINPRLIKAKVNLGNNPHFLREFLKSDTVFKQFELLSRGGTMGVINIGILNEIFVASPPLEEQQKISVFINERKNTFSFAIEKAEAVIKFLSERRTALISAAVTGKIDVRDWQPDEKRNQESAA